MKKRLHHIATIQTGVFAQSSAEGSIVYLQAKHFNELGELTATLHADLLQNKSIQKHLLQKGDLLFAAKGTKNFAAIYDFSETCVASTSFFVIRLQTNDIIPEFLAWHLNQPNTQAALKAQAIGTAIVSISKAVLENIEIPIPNIYTQHKILKINQLRHHEKLLHQQIEQLKDKKINLLITNTLN